MTNCSRKVTAHWQLINTIAERRFPHSSLAEEGALYVLNWLEEDNCRRLDDFGGRAKMSTYVTVLTIRLLEDFSRRKFGRVRPPQWITSLGGIWLNLFQLLCLQRFQVTEAVETVKTQRPDSDMQQLEDAAWTVLERIINCGKHQGVEVSFADDESAVTAPHDQLYRRDTPEDECCTQDMRDFYELIFSDSQIKTEGLNEGSLKKILRSSVQLSGQERLLLKLCFQEELSVTRAGKMLGFNANQAHGKLRRLLARLRSDFEVAGIADELRAMLHG